MNKILKTIKYSLGIMVILAFASISMGQVVYADTPSDYGSGSYYDYTPDYGSGSYYNYTPDYGSGSYYNYTPDYGSGSYYDSSPTYTDNTSGNGYGTDYGYYYGDNCGSSCDTTNYGTDQGYYYGNNCDTSCDTASNDYGYGGSGGGYGGCSYGCGSSNSGSYGMPSYNSYGTPSYNPPSYNYNPTPTYYNPPSSNGSGAIVVNNNNNNTNNNTNNNNVVVNIPPVNTVTPPPPPPPPVYNNLTAYCVGTPSNPQIGDNVTWRVYASGGNGNYNYSWRGDVSGNNTTENANYYNSGTESASVRVTTSNGDSFTTDQCEVNVQPRGSTISNVTVYTPPTGTPSAGVFLSQIPATGISPTMKLALFILGLFLWSAFGAYMILERRKMGTLATAGINASDMEDEADEVVTEPTESIPADDLESNLSFRARENNVLISRDGLAVIMNRANGNQGEAENILSQLVSKVSRNDGDYATLNGEKINKLLNS